MLPALCLLYRSSGWFAASTPRPACRANWVPIRFLPYSGLYIYVYAVALDMYLNISIRRFLGIDISIFPSPLSFSRWSFSTLALIFRRVGGASQCTWIDTSRRFDDYDVAMERSHDSSICQPLIGEWIVIAIGLARKTVFITTTSVTTRPYALDWLFRILFIFFDHLFSLGPPRFRLAFVSLSCRVIALVFWPPGKVVLWKYLASVNSNSVVQRDASFKQFIMKFLLLLWIIFPKVE